MSANNDAKSLLKPLLNPRHSLTLRLALIFALLAFASLATLGVALYHGLETQLIRRDDAALIGRVDQLRNLLQDSNTLELIRTRPALFQNMVGNHEALLVVGEPGKAPLVVVNPTSMALPQLEPISADQALDLSMVQHLPGTGDVPFAAVSAMVRTDNPSTGLQVMAGRLMNERTAVLASYQVSVFLLASVAAILLALAGYFLVHHGLLPLRKLARHTQGIGVANLSERLDSRGAPVELLPMIDGFNAMLDRLATGFAQLSQVSTDMAHELRTPINNLLGETQVALHQPRSMEAYQHLLASNVEELERLARMLDNMLFLARTDPGSALSQRQQLDAQDEMQRIADYFEGVADDAGVTIAAQASGTVWAEPMLLRRALANLCANAIRYAEPGSVIEAVAIPGLDGIELTVCNHGETIPAEHLPKLFDRFYRVDQARARSAVSNGLGLSIVASIMELHGGRYGASSTGGLTRFSLFFPRQ